MICADTTFCGAMVSAGAPEWTLARQSVAVINADYILTAHPRKFLHKFP